MGLELLAELYENDVGVRKSDPLGTGDRNEIRADDEDITSYYRGASRAVVLNARDEMALLHVAKHGYYKLPGGGINEGESRIAALHREVLEEIGCRISAPNPVGIIVEHRDRVKVTQLSFCYLAKVKGRPGRTSLDEGEEALGFETKWLGMEKALSLIEGSDRPNYLSRFMVARDALFIRKAMELAYSGSARDNLFVSE